MPNRGAKHLDKEAAAINSCVSKNTPTLCCGLTLAWGCVVLRFNLGSCTCQACTLPTGLTLSTLSNGVEGMGVMTCDQLLKAHRAVQSPQV